jgi:acyl-CoA synthetase (AMP-forming)/AMP-acid ligase II
MTENVLAMINRRAREKPEETALLFEEERMTRRDLAIRVNRVAAALAGLGVTPGDKVGILGSSSLAYVELFFGAIRAGARAVPFPDKIVPESLAKMIDDSDAKALAVSRSRREMLDLSSRRFSKLLPEGRVSIDFEESHWTSYDALLATVFRKHRETPVRADDDFNIIYSSGTTGDPRGIVHSNRMRSYQVKRMGRLGLDDKTRLLVSTPLYSNATLVALLPTLALGGTAIIMPRFDPGRFLELSEKWRVTHAMLTTVQFRRLLDDPGFGKRDLSSYESKFSTGATFPVGLKREVLERWPGGLVEIYGLTEGGCTTLLDAGKFPEKLESVGRLAEGVEVRILDRSGKALPAGETGEIAGRAVSMMTGYHKRDDLTEEITWRDEKGRIFYRTGDLGRFDDDRFLYHQGRKKDVIISGGMNVYAVDLERLLFGHPAVEEAAVIGVASDEWGETPLALVTLKAGANVDPEELRDWANSRLATYQRISEIELRKSLPRNALGKVIKDELP